MSRCTLAVLILLLVPILGLLVIMLWVWLQRTPKQKEIPLAQKEETKPATTVASVAATAASRAAAAPATPAEPAVPPKPDDLKRIEGIGPKISALLQEAGISTFAQLAAAEASRLEEILAEAGLSALAKPATWPEQASLAAAGDWEALEALQNELKGGRRV
ncbi:MAG: DUF4332 domain-containing protein [Anaerolineae bacterium]|nr:DUF4332 domain-containing protein [Anaerolineae bacterium]